MWLTSPWEKILTQTHSLQDDKSSHLVIKPQRDIQLHTVEQGGLK